MRASGTTAYVEPHRDVSLHTRSWSGSRNVQGFDSFLSELGIPSGQSASTTTAAAAAPAATTAVAAAAAPATGATASALQLEVATAAAPAAEAQASTSTVQTAAGAAAASASTGTQGPQSCGGPGLTTASGTPLIILNSQPAAGYQGPAAYNPYYWTGETPYQAGTVVGYQNWFQTIDIGTFDPSSNAVSFEVDPRCSANLAGGEEALRLVQQYVPNATLRAQDFPCQLPGQPQSYDVQLPNGELMNAGLILASYYNESYGVTQGSDAFLQEQCQIALAGAPS